MDFTFVVPVLISFVLSVIMGPIVIPMLRKMKMKQTERVEGVESHLQKAGTPTMGGVMILASIVVTSLFYVKDYPKIIPILFVTLGFGLIGFLDDYLKVVMKRSDGLFPKQKFALQIVITAVFAYYLIHVTHTPLTLLIPFSEMCIRDSVKSGFQTCICPVNVISCILVECKRSNSYEPDKCRFL